MEESDGIITEHRSWISILGIQRFVMIHFNIIFTPFVTGQSSKECYLVDRISAFPFHLLSAFS